MDEVLDSLFSALQIHPTELSYSRGRNELRAYFTADAFVPRSAQHKLEKKLLEAMPGCGLDLQIAYTNPAELLQTDFDEIAAMIAEKWLEGAPQLHPFFKAAQWSHDDNTVSAHLRQGVTRIPGVDAYCKQYTNAASAVIGLPLTLELVFDETPKAAAPGEGADEAARPAKIAPKKETTKKETPKKETKKAAPQAQGKLLYGRTLPRLERALCMRDVQEGAGTITVCGTIISMESREKKDGGLILQAALTDRTGAVPIKLFLEPNEKTVAARVAECQKKGDRLIVHGSYTMDNYLKRMCLLVRDMAVTPAIYRKDTAEEKRVELHLHTKMSSMDALVEPADAVKTAARWGHKAVAITDHGVVQAFPAAVNAANKLKKDGVDIKVILGVEGYLSPDCTLCQWEGKTFVSVSITAAKGLDLPCVFQIAAERFTATETIDTFSALVDTGMPLPAEVARETGLREADMQDAYVLYDAIRALREFAGDGVWVADAETAFTLCSYCERLEFPPRRAYADALRLFGDCYHDKETPVLTGSATLKAERQAALMRTMLLHLKEKNVETLPLFDAIPVERAKGKRTSYHIILLAKNHAGLLNLYRLVSYAHLDHLKKVPRIPKSLLSLYREGIIVGGACEAGEVFRAVLDNKPEQAIRDIASFYDYMEIQPIGNNAFLVREERVKDDEALRELNRRILALGDALGKPTVATGDVHFLDPEDAVFRAVLMSARDFKDAEQQAPLYFKTTQEMLDEFSYLGERAREVVIDNPDRIAAQCEVMPPFLSEKSTYAPTFPGANDELRGMAEKRAHELYGAPLPEVVQKRLDKELNSIIGNGYASLYLMAQRLVKKSNDDGYLVGSRGSVGSSFVATMAGITEVNPLQPHYVCPHCKHSDFDVDRSQYACGVDLPDKACPVCGTKYLKLGYEIPFETFLGFKGDKTPDIDLNFSGEYQPRAHAYTEVMFGKGHAFRAGTISGLQAKTVYGYVMKYCEQNNITLGRDEIDRLVAGCCGVKRTTGQHPGGIVIVPEENDIMEFTPIQYPADKASAGTITTHFDFHAMDDRLVKLDILGHVDPTALRMLQDMTGLDPKEIPQDDPETMQLFSTQAPLGVDLKALDCDVGSIGIPEFGTGFVRQMLMDTRPTTMEELVRIAGLSHGTDVWLGNAQELVKSGRATLRDVICTRDDIMNYLILQGGDPSMSFKTMESVRKGRGLTPEMEAHMRGLPIYDWFPDSCKKIGYMFPRAHAAAYVMMAFRVAYYKVHYPLAFYAVYFQCRAADAFDQAFASGGADKVLKNIKAIRKKGNDADPKEADLLTALEAVYEMNLRGIELLDVDIYKSDARRFLIEGNALRPPLCAVAGVGENAAEGVAAAANGGAYGSIEDFQKRTKANSGVVNALREAGCLDGLPETNQITLFQGLI